MRCYSDQSTLASRDLITRFYSDPTVRRPIFTAIGALYLLSIAGGRWLPTASTWVAAGLALTGIIALWVQAGRPRDGTFRAALGIPLHLTVLAGGGLTSPIAPLIALWTFYITRSWGSRRVVLSGLGFLAWILAAELAWDQFGYRGLMEGTLLIVVGITPAIMRGRTELQTRALGEGSAEATIDWPEAPDEREPTERVARQSNAEIQASVVRIRKEYSAERAVLWMIDGEEGEARPEWVSGKARPPRVTLMGDPIGHALNEMVVLRLENPPRWAPDTARSVIVPVEWASDQLMALTLDLPEETEFPEVAQLEETAANLRVLLEMLRESELAAEVRGTFDRVIGLLRQLPLQLDARQFAEHLARAAAELVGGSGAAVASWNGDQGEFLAVTGADSGVLAGTRFGPEESEIALVATRGTALVRTRRRGERRGLPLLADAERWYAEPEEITFLPLENPASGVVGVLAIWSTDPIRIGTEEIETLQLVAPFAAMQLHHLDLYGPLQDLADRDPLTRLYNRRVFTERIEQETARFHRYGRSTALLILDIDHFKAVNDTYGHEVGDDVLRGVAGVIQSATRDTDLAARFGGEEFVVLLPETSRAGATEIAERLRREVEELIVESEGHTITVQASIGVASSPECAPSPDQLIAVADAALYQAKREGRNRVIAAPLGVSSGHEG